MKKLIPVAAILLAVSSCYNDKYDKLYPSVTSSCDTTTITYSHDIAPIIAANCFSPGNGCHDAAGSRTSGFNYQTDITGLQANAASGDLIGTITWAAGNNPMPKNGTKLSDCDINKIARWVHQGAPNN